MDEIKDYPPYLDYPKPSRKMTNGDRIRAISDEELAESRCIEIKGLYPWPIFFAFDVPGKRFLSRESAVAEELNWLQQPAEEDDDVKEKSDSGSA